MFNSVKNTTSLLRIVRVLARHDALFMFEHTRLYPVVRTLARALGPRARHVSTKRKGQRLADALVELGPSFIKLGQVLSTRSDLIGDTLARDLALLQDKLPPFPTHIARRMVEEELGAPLDTLFTHFESKPVAAASMAQVHFATTTQGADVAVKILRPDVEKRFRRDLALFRWLADLMDRTMPELRRMRPKEMVETMCESVEMELDLRYEAAAAVELKENMQGEDGFYVSVN